MSTNTKLLIGALVIAGLVGGYYIYTKNRLKVADPQKNDRKVLLNGQPSKA